MLLPINNYVPVQGLKASMCKMQMNHGPAPINIININGHNRICISNNSLSECWSNSIGPI